MNSKKCLVVDPMHESFFSMMEKIGWTCDYKPNITREEISREHEGYDGLVVRSKTRVDRALLGENPTIRFIARAGAGIDNIDVDYVSGKGIKVIHAAEGNRDAVGEFTLGILLALTRNIPRANDEVHRNVWEREGNRGEEISGKTVGLIGFGNMGQAAARCLSGLGCKILAYDKYKSGFGTAFCQEVEMQRIFDEADILSLHIPLTHETRGMVSLSYFDQFRKNIILVNTARGEIVRLHDLNLALERGKVRGAALDVLENEKINQLTSEQQFSFNNLKGKSNVILTPHIAGWTFESHVKINVALVDKIRMLDV